MSPIGFAPCAQRPMAASAASALTTAQFGPLRPLQALPDPLISDQPRLRLHRPVKGVVTGAVDAPITGPALLNPSGMPVSALMKPIFSAAAFSGAQTRPVKALLPNT